MTTNSIGGIWLITYFVYLMFDFLVLNVAWTVSDRTSGGKLSISYGVIGLGCGLLAIYHIIYNFLIAGNAFSFNHPVQLIFVFAVVALTLGTDTRAGVEKQLEKYLGE